MKVDFTAPKRLVNRVFIHCSATDNPAHDSVKWIRDLHMRENRWSDCGYNAFVRKSGLLEWGRDLEKMPAAQAGNNLATIAICLSGLSGFTQAQFKTLRAFCEAVHEQLPLVTFHGHCEVANKLCPNFPYQQIIGIGKKGELLASPLD